MKTSYMARPSVKVAFAVLLAIALAMVFSPMNAYAASLTKATLKSVYDSDSVATQQKKATTIKKTGRYAIVSKNGAGIIKFKAPKTKTYKFTFSKLKSSKATDVACVVGFCKIYSGGDYTYLNVKTKEGKRPRAPFVSASLADGKTVTLDGYDYKRLATRTAKLAIKKGQTVYIALGAKNMSNSYVRSSYRVAIS